MIKMKKKVGKQKFCSVLKSNTNLNVALFTKIVIFYQLFSVITILTLHQSESTINIPSTSSQTIEETARPLPLRNHTWRIIRENNFLYIDKTPFLMKLFEVHSFVILTRPPGFGKTMFIDMMADFFRGKKDMFKGLAIDAVGNTEYSPWTWVEHRAGKPLPKWKEFPVIHLNFSEISKFSTKEEFDGHYLSLLKRIAETYGVEVDKCHPERFYLTWLIWELHLKFNRTKVIVLVDDYDYPFQHAYTVLNNTELATYVKKSVHFMMNKISHDEVGFAFLASVLKLNKVPLDRSGMERFHDITFEEDFALAFGFTENEIENNMSVYLTKWARKRNATVTAQNISDDLSSAEKNIVDELKSWYGGYQFSEKCDASEVLNPISTIESLQNQEFDNYCTFTDSMRFLVDRYYKKRYSWSFFTLLHPIDMIRDFRLSFSRINEAQFHFWLLSHGYYTISGDWHNVKVTFPNEKIEEFIEYNLAMCLPGENKFIHKDYGNDLSEFNKAMSTQDTEKAMRILSIFQFQPYICQCMFDKYFNPGQMSRSLGFFLRATSINYQDVVKFNTDHYCYDSTAIEGNWDILQTTDLNMNYIIKIRTTNYVNKTALPVIEQLLGYYEDHPELFTQSTKNQTKVCFLGLNFVLLKRSVKLNSWIAMPYANGTLQISDVVAQPKDLKRRLLEKYGP